jgi:hypothetical protein
MFECLKGLSDNRICVLTPPDCTIKNYTEIFHFFYKGNVASYVYSACFNIISKVIARSKEFS